MDNETNSFSITVSVDDTKSTVTRPDDVTHDIFMSILRLALAKRCYLKIDTTNPEAVMLFVQTLLSRELMAYCIIRGMTESIPALRERIESTLADEEFAGLDYEIVTSPAN